MFKVVHCFDHASEEDTTFATPHEVAEFAEFDENFDVIRPRFSKKPHLQNAGLFFTYRSLDGFREVMLQNRETGEERPVYLGQVEGYLEYTDENKELGEYHLLRYDLVTPSEDDAETANDSFSSGGLGFTAARKVKMIKVVDPDYFNAAFGISQA